MYHLYLWYFLRLTVFSGSVVAGHAIFNLDAKNVLLEFDPYVSILDRTNLSRYGMLDLVSLVSHVATKFTKIYIQLEHTGILDGETNSQYMSPFAIAEYNCLPKTKYKLQLVLGVTEISCNCSDFQTIRYPIESFADQINNVCNETVNTIVIETSSDFLCQSSSESCKSTQNRSNSLSKFDTRNYTWGIITMFDDYCSNNVHVFTNFDPTVFVLTYCINSTDCKLNEVILLKFLSADLTKCKSSIQPNNKSFEFVKKFRFSDTEQDFTMNMSFAMKTWEKVLSFPGYSYILSQAFDTYAHLYRAPFWETSGWWFVVNSKQYSNLSSFSFVEKNSVAYTIDLIETPKNFKWLQEHKILYKMSTGLIYSGNVPTSIFEKNFCKVMIFDVKRSINMFKTDNFRFTNPCGMNLEVVLLTQEPIDEKLLELLPKSNTKNFVLVVPLPNFGTYDLSYLSNNKTLGIQYGYAIDMEICFQYDRLDDESKGEIYRTLGDKYSSMYIFHFEETKYLIQLGATRMFRQRVQLLEKCIHMISSRRDINAKIGFAMIRYQKLSNFDKSPWAMQNFVKYIYLLDDWARKQNNTVFYVCDDTDGTKTFNDGSTHPIVGWYSLENQNGLYISKTEQALKLSRIMFPEQNEDFGFSKSSVIIIAGITVLVCVFISFIVLILVKRQYKLKNIHRDEIYAFFRGAQPDPDTNEYEINNAPYDKLKYEIPNAKFIIEAGTKLGSGEYGEVFRGSISAANGNISVAIKTTNSQKSHKTKLTGFLSEIKVLSYLDKHPNITELMGANTTSLKDEKVYIFLELCHLGSLEKYLRDTRTLLVNRDSNLSFDDDNQVSSVSIATLDPSLSQDLYRWCTEICNGMAYLTDKHVVHADLAARNVLLNLRKEAKICDFGLSRRMYNYTNYVKTQQEPLPWKWMAPEALRFMTFNEKTDVWAYGVTVWEIYSLGNTPFAGLSWDMNFPQCLERGLKLSKPEYEENNMYELMLSCWVIRPENRFSFAQIQSRLALGSVQQNKE